MSLDDQHLKSMPRGRLLLLTLLAFVAGFVIVFGAIVPAEFGRDPTGLGKLAGLSRLWAPPEKTLDANAGSVARAHEYPTGFRTDVIEIPLTGFLGGRIGSELEYKVLMKKDAVLIYEWQVTGADRADDFHYDFHGHTKTVPGESMTVATYRQAFGDRKSVV